MCTLILLRPPAHLHHLQAKEQRAKERQELKQELKLEIKAEQVTLRTLRTLRTLHTFRTLRTHPPHLPRTFRTFRALCTLCIPHTHTPRNLRLLHPCTTCVLCRSWLLPRGGSVEPRSRASPRGGWPPSLA
eukprot:scaffold3602_cov46-Phaeocystis_antarctica.AAC.2